MADTSSASNAFAIAPDDLGNLTVTRGVYVGNTGNLHVLTMDGDDITFIGLVAGVVHPLRVKRVFATGTTAGNIIGVR